MKREQEAELFKAIREIPPELSLSEVQQIITLLPTLPMENSWIHNLFTKSVIMSSVTITLISAAVFMFYPQDQPLVTLISEEEAPATLAYEAEEAPFQEIALDLPTEVQVFENNGMQSDLQSTIVLPEDRQEQDSLPSQLFNPEIIDEPSLLVQNSDPTKKLFPESSEGTWLDRAEYNLSVLDTTPIIELNGKFEIEDEHSGYSDLPIGKVKRELFRKLKKDNFISSKKELVILKLKEDEIQINDKTLSPQQEKSYADWLSNYNIRRGPEHQIRICTNYIMIGDFDVDGHFNGRARGKNMILKFKEENSESIFDQKN